MRFFPFFLECSKRENNRERKKQLEQLGFGKCGLIVEEEDGSSYLIQHKTKFLIPTTYSDDQRNKLNMILWGEDSDFERMESAIKESIRNWSNIKKRDKLRIIDKYVLQLACDFKEKKMIKSVLTIALILRLIQSNDIVFENFEIKNIEGTFDFSFLSQSADDHAASRSSRSNSGHNKVSSKDIWKKMCGTSRVA